MEKNTDIEFKQTSEGYYDLSLDESGDFSKTNSFDTSILLSIFCERRATVTEVPISFRRRGWIGNIDRPVEYGSKVWLLEQSRLTNSTVNIARDYLRQALQWLIDFGYLKEILVETDRDLTRNALLANITLVRFDDKVEHKNFVLWENTGRGLNKG